MTAVPVLRTSIERTLEQGSALVAQNRIRDPMALEPELVVAADDASTMRKEEQS